MRPQRLTRVNQLLKQEVAEQLFRIMHEPGFDAAACTVTRVLTSSDLVTWNYANFFVIPPASPLITKGSAGATTTRLVVKPAGTRAFFKVIALKPPAQP